MNNEQEKSIQLLAMIYSHLLSDSMNSDKAKQLASDTYKWMSKQADERELTNGEVTATVIYIFAGHFHSEVGRVADMYDNQHEDYSGRSRKYLLSTLRQSLTSSHLNRLRNLMSQGITEKQDQEKEE